MFKQLPTILITSALFFSFTASSSADQKDTDTEQEVLAAFDSLVAASRALDANLYFQHFDNEKFIGLNSDGTNWNSIEELRPLIVGGFDSIQTVDSLEFTNVRVSVIDPYTAVLVNEYYQSMTLKDGSDIRVAGGGS